MALGEDHAVVSVRDHGEGIPLAQQGHVFERFHRIANPLTARAGGTGLGLYISKRLVDAMAGRLSLSSRPGDGCTFPFTLPLAPAAIELEPVEAPAEEGLHLVEALARRPA